MTVFSPGLGASSSGSAVIIEDAGGEQVTVTDGKLDVNASIDATGLATGQNQESQIALATTLGILVETLNELNARLMVLASMANSGAPALRTIPIASVSTAVTGTLTAVTTVGTITNFGTGIPASEMVHDMNNMTAVLANINNVSITA